jgi:hypothetical protein
MTEYLKDEKHPMRSDVMEWYAEFGESNYDYCKQILTFFEDARNFKIDKYGEKTLKPLQEKAVNEIGLKISKRGGFIALRSNYYTMLNFMISDPKLKNDVRSLKYYWWDK